jgi:hypothetical protein
MIFCLASTTERCASRENVFMLRLLILSGAGAMLRKFAIGQFVEYRPSPGNRDALSQVYRITSLLPPREGGGEHEYLIKNSNEGYERIVGESQLQCLQRSRVDERTPTKRR